MSELKVTVRYDGAELRDGSASSASDLKRVENAAGPAGGALGKTGLAAQISGEKLAKFGTVTAALTGTMSSMPVKGEAMAKAFGVIGDLALGAVNPLYLVVAALGAAAAAFTLYQKHQENQTRATEEANKVLREHVELIRDKARAEADSASGWRTGEMFKDIEHWMEGDIQGSIEDLRAKREELRRRLQGEVQSTRVVEEFDLPGGRHGARMRTVWDLEPITGKEERRAAIAEVVQITAEIERLTGAVERLNAVPWSPADWAGPDYDEWLKWQEQLEREQRRRRERFRLGIVPEGNIDEESRGPGEYGVRTRFAGDTMRDAGYRDLVRQPRTLERAWREYYQTRQDLDKQANERMHDWTEEQNRSVDRMASHLENTFNIAFDNINTSWKQLVREMLEYYVKKFLIKRVADAIARATGESSDSGGGSSGGGVWGHGINKSLEVGPGRPKGMQAAALAAHRRRWGM